MGYLRGHQVICGVVVMDHCQDSRFSRLEDVNEITGRSKVDYSAEARYIGDSDEV